MRIEVVGTLKPPAAGAAEVAPPKLKGAPDALLAVVVAGLVAEAAPAPPPKLNPEEAAGAAAVVSAGFA